MKKGISKLEVRRYVADTLRHRPDNVPIEQIVYLDDDLPTFTYFMTGEFDEEAREKMIAQ